MQGYTPIADGFWPWLRNLILPSVALGMAYVALIARITRASMLEVLAEDYMRTARGEGASRCADAVQARAEERGACRSSP